MLGVGVTERNGKWDGLRLDCVVRLRRGVFRKEKGRSYINVGKTKGEETIDFGNINSQYA